MNINMSLEESRAWRPDLIGNSDDILPFYRAFAESCTTPPNVVELGVATGRSIIFLASEFVRLGKKAYLFGIDPWLEEFKSGWYAQSLRSIVQHATNAELEMLYLGREMPGSGSLPRSMDSAFIDCLHTRATVAYNIKLVQGRARIVSGHDFCHDWPDVGACVTEAFGEVNHFHSVWWT